MHVEASAPDATRSSMQQHAPNFEDVHGVGADGARDGAERSDAPLPEALDGVEVAHDAGECYYDEPRARFCGNCAASKRVIASLCIIE